MKKIMFLMVAAAMMMACGGQSAKNESEADSLALGGDSVVAEAEEEVAAEEAVVEEPVLNADLFGKWSNRNDPGIDMTVSDKYGTYDDYKGYGFVRAANEYFEYDFTLVFTELTPDGDKIRVKYNKLDIVFTGDPDDPDSEGTWETKKVGSGELTLVPAGAKKVKIESSERRIKGATLYK